MKRNLTIVAFLIFATACGVEAAMDQTSMGGAGGSGQSGGAGGSVVSNGGSVSSGGSISSGGIGGYAGGNSIYYPPKPTTLCPTMFNVGPTTVSIGGYSFSQDWIARPSADGYAIVVNPVWPFANNLNNCITYPGQVVMKPYDLTTDTGVVVDPTPAKEQLDNKTGVLTSEGIRFDLRGTVSGNIHFNVVTVVGSVGYWMIINGAAYSPNLPVQSRLSVEKSQKASEQGSVGMVLRWDGNAVSIVSAFGGNYVI